MRDDAAVTEGDVRVQLLAGFNEATGRPVHEELRARHEGGDRYVVLATPGLANGCAAGDTVQVDGDGRFTVVERGGNVAVHVGALRRGPGSRRRPRRLWLRPAEQKKPANHMAPLTKCLRVT